ncbi:TPA: hypothetical protein ACF4EY_004421 [Vibrio parahaemolyticus]
MNNKKLLSEKKKFISQLLSRYSFWCQPTQYQTQKWTKGAVSIHANCIVGAFKPIGLSSYEHLTIMPLVFDYLDVTVALKYGLRDQPFSEKSRKLTQSLDQSFISQLTLVLYENMYKVRNKLLHHKGGLSECGKNIVVIKDQFQIPLDNLRYINILVPFLTKHLDDSSEFNLYEKSLIWSYFKKSGLIDTDNQILLDAVKKEEIIELSPDFRFHIDMFSREYSTFEELRHDLECRFLNEHGNLIGNTLFSFNFQGEGYAVPAEYLRNNVTFNLDDLHKWRHN